MAFCTNCGNKLSPDDRFCARCGKPVPKPEPQSPKTEQMTKLPDQGKGKKKNWIIAGGAAGLLIFIVLVIAVIKLRPVKDTSNYVTYTNSNVNFSVDYPEEYMLTEPNDNNVLIADKEQADFQVSIEYAYCTTTGSAIYSAKDFADQISNDQTVLNGWLGTDDMEIDDTRQTTIAGRDCYAYDFHLQIDGNPNTGNLYIFDGDGEFGCYSYLCVINENAKDAELYKLQSKAMEESFRITGAYQQEGYTVYSYDEFDLKFMVRDEAMGETENSGGCIVVYPVDHIYTEANIWIDEGSASEDEKDVATVLEDTCRYYFNYRDQTQYTSQPTVLSYGRYPCTVIELEYDYRGEHFTMSAFALVHNGTYWTITMQCTDEYYDTAVAAVSDIIFSMKFGDYGATGDNKSMEDIASEVLDSDTDDGAAPAKVIEKIEATSGFVSNGTWEPLAVADDFNGDGVQELLAVYEVNSGSGMQVMYDVWSLGSKGAVCLKTDILFQEVGGNSGIVGIVKEDGTAYVAIERHEPEGDAFNNYFSYIPWNSDESSLEESDVYMESHGTYGEEDKGRYILGDSSVDKKEFDERQADFSNWLYKLNILDGAGNGGVKTFDDIK